MRAGRPRAPSRPRRHLRTALIGRLQPALIDRRFRRRLEERLLLRESLVAQACTGPDGRKQVAGRAEGGGQARQMPASVANWGGIRSNGGV